MVLACRIQAVLSQARSSLVQEGSLKIPQRLCVHASFTPPGAVNLQSVRLRLCGRGECLPKLWWYLLHIASSFLPQPGLIRLSVLL